MLSNSLLCSFARKSLRLKQCFSTLSSDTIFALSSGQGKCGVAVIRVSGPYSQEALLQLTRLPKLPEPRHALLRSIKHPVSSETLDKGLVIWFPGPRCFTGEDSFELHVHGGLAVVTGVLNALQSIPKLRLAEPGEFTRRAFYNKKLDLTEVEGLADLLQAETELQRKQAFLQSQGALSKLYNRWKQSLTGCVAHIEAQIDFEETDTLELGLLEAVSKNVQKLIDEIEKHINDGRKGEMLRQGVRTIILGEPNVGKSSILNLLCQRPAAIVTPIEGTTRDILEITLNIGGYPLVIADTAGLRTTTLDQIEKEGIRRALELLDTSNLVLLVIDSEKYLKWSVTNVCKRFSDYVLEYLKQLDLQCLIKNENDRNDLFNKQCIVVLNKVDLLGSKIDIDINNTVTLSCKTEKGISKLTNVLSNKLKTLCGEPTEEHPSLNQARHRQHLKDCVNYLKTCLQESSKGDACDLVIMAEYLRKSLRHLGKLVGHVSNEQLLDIIFNEFCIGK
ncbi:unnamed protein product [Acanthoscelides obtectus]|uniref:TrmE-type G domain-containing protein n=1 Tax=Acanthoscelides obtectus TaxID=200917 RepID=A0A9P0KZU4_ACAOB|nr:unnamed protein product [Acanthoscelides obtectus]CAK1678321.1 tRNA modification GTPase GTPBP3, mitochondrial [Acanthoscelides obtectus]